MSMEKLGSIAEALRPSAKLLRMDRSVRFNSIVGILEPYVERC